MSLAVRLHPTGASEVALARQWIRSRSLAQGAGCRISIIRTVPEDPDALPPFPPLTAGGRREVSKLVEAWASAQLVADVTLLGLAVGVRVALVPEQRRWFADTLVIRTGDRLRTGPGHLDAVSALRALRDEYLETLGTDAVPNDQLGPSIRHDR